MKYRTAYLCRTLESILTGSDRANPVVPNISALFLNKRGYAGECLQANVHQRVSGMAFQCNAAPQVRAKTLRQKFLHS